MSIDGTGILVNDLARDVYNKVLDVYDAGVAVSESSDQALVQKKESDIRVVRSPTITVAAIHANWFAYSRIIDWSIHLG
jgi:hypothetical protein